MNANVYNISLGAGLAAIATGAWLLGGVAAALIAAGVTVCACTIATAHLAR